MLVDTLGIPALICVDADPGGIQVALTYAHGSVSTALETPWLACNNIWWAGVYPSDIDRYCRKSDLIRLSETDDEGARRLLAHPSDAYVNKRVRDELAILIPTVSMTAAGAKGLSPKRITSQHSSRGGARPCARRDALLRATAQGIVSKGMNS
jgi:hypothetical protein